MARIDPQLKLRVSDELKDLITKAAKNNNRSVNAEIVARIEAYDAIYEHMRQLASDNERLSGELDATKHALSEQKRISDGLQKLLKDHYDEARSKSDNEQETLNAIESRFNDLKKQSDYLESLKEAMREELAELSRERGDIDAQRDWLLEKQSAALEELAKTNKITGQLLEKFRDAFLDAASGNREELEKMIGTFAKAFPNE